MMRPEIDGATADLFGIEEGMSALPEGALLLPGFALPADALLAALAEMVANSPFRHMTTPGGHAMSVAMTNCGSLGWVSDHAGYRYQPLDPQTGRAWPVMPPSFFELARRAAAASGYSSFLPDACLVNRYEPGTRLSLHQDRNERDMDAPIVSVSLGLPAIFLFGGNHRSERPQRLPLVHGDVLVWGGSARLAFHGVLPIAGGTHPKVGSQRLNLTFRKAS